MKPQITLLLLSIIALSLSSCDLISETKEEFNQRPTLRLGYQYINGNDQNTTLEEVRKIDVTIYNAEGQVVKTDELLKSQIELYQPLYGVPEGEYTVVSRGNADSTTITDTKAYLPSDKTHATSDALFYHRASYIVKRGHPELNTISLDKLYFEMTLRIVGLRGLDDKSLTDFSVELSGTPCGFTNESAPLEPMVIRPRLRQVADTTFASFNTHRFDDAATVTLILKHKADILAQFPLSEYIADTKSEIDIQNDRDVLIPIELNVTTTDTTIIINDWAPPIDQHEDVGV